MKRRRFSGAILIALTALAGACNPRVAADVACLSGEDQSYTTIRPCLRDLNFVLSSADIWQAVEPLTVILENPAQIHDPITRSLAADLLGKISSQLQAFISQEKRRDGASTCCQGVADAILGVFSGVQLFFYYNFDSGQGRPFPTCLFRIDFDPINRMASQLPIGDNAALDPVVLDPLFDRTTASGSTAERYDKIMNAIENYAKLNAATAAHELAHALGVSIGSEDPDEDENQWPPQGAFGGYPTAFPGFTDSVVVVVDAHLYLRGYEPYGYFPGSAFNVLDSGQWSYPGLINTNTGYTSFEKSYLLQKTFYLDDDEFPGYGCYGSTSFPSLPPQCFIDSVPNPTPSCPQNNPQWYYCIDQSPIP